MVKKEKLELLPYFNKGLELYRQRKFQEAKQYFKKCLEILPEDGPSHLYVERCDEYIANPPPADWDGVYIMKTK